MTTEAASTAPPVAARNPVVRSHHGDDVEDAYEWFRAKEDAAVIAHLEAENAYTKERTAHLAGLQETIFGEIKGRTLETDLSVPTRRGDWWYYGRTVEGKQYGIQCRAPLAATDDWTPPDLAGDAEVDGEQVLLDGNIEATGHEFFSLGSFEVTTAGDLMLYGVDVAGDERYTVRVRNLVTGEQLPDEIPGTFAGATFSPDGRFIVYTTVDDAWRPDTVWLHELGTPIDQDEKLFHEPDERFWLGAGFTRSDRYLVIGMGSSITSEEWLVDAADLRSEPRVVWPRSEGVEYDSSHAVIDGEDVLFILHNDGALDFELVRVAASDPAGARQVVVPHRPGERLLGVSTFRDWAVLGYRRGGLARLGMLSYADGAVSELRVRRAALLGRLRRQPGVGAAPDPHRLRLVRDPGHGVRLRGRDRRAAPAQAPARAGRLRTRGLRAGAGVGDCSGRHADPDLPRLEALVRRCGRHPASAAPLRLRLLRALDRARVSPSRVCPSSTAA